MATDIMFPLYDILVNNIFGSVGISIVAMGIILGIILMITRTGQSFSIYWLLFYFVTMITLYFGSVALVIGIGLGLFMIIKTYLRGQGGGQA